MTSVELLELIDKVVKSRAEYQYVELKAAKQGCPENFMIRFQVFLIVMMEVLSFLESMKKMVMNNVVSMIYRIYNKE